MRSFTFNFALYLSLATVIQSWSITTVARPLPRVNKIAEIGTIQHRLGSIYNQVSVEKVMRTHGINNDRVKGIFEAGRVLYEELAKQQEVGMSENSGTVPRLAARGAETLARRFLAMEIKFVTGSMTVQDFLQKFEMLLATNNDLFSADKIDQMNDYLHNGIVPMPPPSHHGMEMEWRELEFRWPDTTGITFIEDYTGSEFRDIPKHR